MEQCTRKGKAENKDKKAVYLWGGFWSAYQKVLHYRRGEIQSGSILLHAKKPIQFTHKRPSPIAKGFFFNALKRETDSIEWTVIFNGAQMHSCRTDLRLLQHQSWPKIWRFYSLEDPNMLPLNANLTFESWPWKFLKIIPKTALSQFLTLRFQFW